MKRSQSQNCPDQPFLRHQEPQALQTLWDHLASLLPLLPPLLTFPSFLNSLSYFFCNLLTSISAPLLSFPRAPSSGSTGRTGRREPPSPLSSWTDSRGSTRPRATSPSPRERTLPGTLSSPTPRSRSGSRTGAPRRRELQRQRNLQASLRSPALLHLASHPHRSIKHALLLRNKHAFNPVNFVHFISTWKIFRINDLPYKIKSSCFIVLDYSMETISHVRLVWAVKRSSLARGRGLADSRPVPAISYHAES